MLLYQNVKKYFYSKYDEGSPAVRLLNAQNAALIITFLYNEFKEKALLSISNSDLISSLSFFLQENLAEIEDELISESLFEEYESKAKRYLDEWTNNSWITKYPDNQGGHLHSITYHTDRVFEFVEKLERRDLVGTESRFQDIIRKLSEIIEKGNEDPKKRIADLEAKKRELDDQIREIAVQGRVVTFTDTEIKERFYEVNRISRELLADFNEVKENFKEIRNEIYQKHAKVDLSKGKILNYTLDALDELKEKDQAKSFYAFMDFLTEDSGKNQLRNLVENVFHLMNQRGLEVNDRFMPKIKTHLHRSAEDVMSYLRLIIEKLNRTLSEKNLLEHKSAFKIIAQIKEKAFQAAEAPPGSDFEIEIEAFPEIDMPMEKQITEDEQEFISFNKPDITEEESVIDFTKFFNGFAVNKEKLEANIKSLLKEKSQVTLLEVTEKYKISEGLAELMTYFSIASGSPKHIILIQEFEYILTQTEIRYKTPRVIYCT